MGQAPLSRSMSREVTGAVIAVAGLACGTAAPPTAAEALVERSIAFHDPDGVWGTREIRNDRFLGADEIRSLAVSSALPGR